MSCRNIIYMHEVLVLLLTETKLRYSAFCYQIEETNFWLFGQVYTNATIGFGNRCFFKDINFYRHEFFRTVSDSCII